MSKHKENDEMTVEEFEEEMAWMSETREYDSYEEYYDDNPEDIPEGCLECGGPYPNCIDGCKMYDD